VLRKGVFGYASFNGELRKMDKVELREYTEAISTPSKTGKKRITKRVIPLAPTPRQADWYIQSLGVFQRPVTTL